MKTTATVYHEIRDNDRIFLCIASPEPVRMDGSIDMAAANEAAKLNYSVERELDPANCTADAIRSLIAEMERESELQLIPSNILREELGL